MPLSAKDRLEILALMARYAHAADGGDGEGFADTFTADALFEGSQRTARGRAELAEVIRSVPPEARSRHWLNSAIIEGGGDEATAKVYLVRIATAGAPAPIASGVYHDRLRRVNGEWKFTHRKVHPDQ